MYTLAIETSCDDTSLALVQWTGEMFVVKNMVSYSQVATHQKYGGVVPELASREHAHQILYVLFHLIGGENVDLPYDVQQPEQLLRSLDAKLVSQFFEKIDTISVTTNPGLPGSLAVGRTIANFLGTMFHKPVQAVNHIHGHIFSVLLERKLADVHFPMMVLTASGGHNELYLVDHATDTLEEGTQQVGNYTIRCVGKTLDDAAGESFDKVSRMLGGPYPGGPWIAKKATDGISRPDIQCTRTFLSASEFNFSFSGVKSQAQRIIASLQTDGHVLTEQDICDIAREFQQAVVEMLAKKLVKAAIQYNVENIALVGGVSANVRLQEVLIDYLSTRYGTKKKNADGSLSEVKVPHFVGAPMQRIYCTDNAAMIGVVGILMQTKL